MPVFHVTYEIVTEESAEHGEAESSGFLLEDCPSLSEAIGVFGSAICADSSHLSLSNPPRWFTTEPEQDYITGEYESRSLHIQGVTPSSAMRIARLLGVA